MASGITQKTKSMTAYKQGQIVLIPYVVLAAITSQVPANLKPDEYLLSGNDQIAAGLPKPSIIKIGKVVTIDQRLIRKSLGQLPHNTFQKAMEILHRNF